ncbi:MAG: DUF2059 domain-containing protein [Hyphomicrobiaceae bacterium]
MHHLTRLVAPLAVAGALFHPAAGAAEPLAHSRADLAQRASLARELLAIVGIKESLGAWKGVLLKGGEQMDCGCSGDEATQARMREAWQRAVNTKFDVAAIEKALARAIAAEFDSQELQEVIDFRRSPLGRKLNALEPPAEQKTVDQAAAARRMVAAYDRLKASPARKATIQEMLKYTGGASQVADIYLEIWRGNVEGAVAAMPKDRPRPTEKEWMAQFLPMRAALAKSLKPAMLADYAERYKTLSVAELETYRNKTADPIGRRFEAVTNRAFKVAMHAQARAIGETYTRMVNWQDL